MIDARPLSPPTRLREPYGEALRIGLIALSTDMAIERDFHRMTRELPIEVFTTRIPLETPNTAATFGRLAASLPNVGDLLIPTSRLDAVVFGCTSASVIIGSDEIETSIRLGRPEVAVSNPAIAVREALRALGARRVAMAAPYTRDIALSTAQFVSDSGFKLVDIAYFGHDLDDDHARIPADAWVAAAAQLSPADAVFLSCTATTALDAITQAEATLGMPVVTSNQASLWHCLVQAGWTDALPGFGRLLDCGGAILSPAGASGPASPTVPRSTAPSEGEASRG